MADSGALALIGCPADPETVELNLVGEYALEGSYCAPEVRSARHAVGTPETKST